MVKVVCTPNPEILPVPGKGEILESCSAENMALLIASEMNPALNRPEKIISFCFPLCSNCLSIC